jgi:exosortase A-associated hydrolase 2
VASTCTVNTRAFYLPAKRGQRFCLFHPALGGRLLGSVLYVHPFAEEMNKSRRMAALQSHAFAREGYAVLQVDLLGCGDSSGDFGDASWDAWLDDIGLACQWLQRHAPGPLWLWGLRAGCLLAADAARRMAGDCQFIFWQPSTSGRLVLQQFLRMKLASDMLSGNAKGAMEALRAELADGRTVEVAGYALSSPLALGLERATLQPPTQTGRVEWLDLSMQEGATLSPASMASQSTWVQAGWHLAGRLVHGPAFWQSSEIEEAPGLIAATLDSLLDRVPA